MDDVCGKGFRYLSLGEALFKMAWGNATEIDSSLGREVIMMCRIWALTDRSKVVEKSTHNSECRAWELAKVMGTHHEENCNEVGGHPGY